MSNGSIFNNFKTFMHDALFPNYLMNFILFSYPSALRILLKMLAKSATWMGNLISLAKNAEL